MHRSPPREIALLAMLLCAVVGLGISVVKRSTAMRGLSVEHERLASVKDSLYTANLQSRLELVAAVRPDKVYRALVNRGYAVPSNADLRFVLYPNPVPGGKGSLTERLSQLVVVKRREHPVVRAGHTRSPDRALRHSSAPDSGRSNGG